MYKNLSLFVSLLISLFISDFAWGQIPQQPPVTLSELISKMVTDSITDITEQLTGQEEFILQFTAFKKEADAQLPGNLERIEGILKDYADSHGLEEPSEHLLANLNELVVDMGRISDRFPRKDEVMRIVGPHVAQFVESLRRELPELEPPTNNDNPFQNIVRFFKETERRNALGLGALFRLESPPDNERQVCITEHVEESNIAGVQKKRVISREVRKFEDGDLVFHQLTKDDQVVLETARADDVSILHGLPAKMRHDGVNENLVLLVEEYIKLVNYHLIKNHEEKGLIIPVGNPQLEVPPNYSLDVFVQNFIAILLSLAARS